MGSRSTRKRNPVQTACFSLSCGQSKGKESRRLTAYEKKMQAVGRIRVGICAGASALIGTPTHFLDLALLSLEFKRASGLCRQHTCCRSHSRDSNGSRKSFISF